MRGAESVVAAALAQANLSLNKHSNHWRIRGNVVCGLCADINAQHYHRSKQKMHVARDEAARMHSNITVTDGSSLVCPLNLELMGTEY